MRTVILRMGAFGFSTILLAISNLVSVPAIIVGGGEAAWAAYVVGQSTGVMLSIVAAFGWTVGGPADAARLRPGDVWPEYRNSLLARLLVFVPSLCVAVFIAWQLSGSRPLEAILVAVGVGITGLGSSWIFVGRQMPVRLLILDVIPRSFSILVGSMIILLTGSLTGFALSLIGGSCLAVLAPLLYLRQSSIPSRGRMASFHDLSAALRRNRAGAIATWSSTIYLSMPALFVGAVSPSSLGQFGLADKLQKFINAGMQPLAQYNQGSVPSGEASQLDQRMKRALSTNLILSIAVGLGTTLLSPWAGSLLSVGRVGIGFDYSVPLGIILFATVMSQCTGMACLTAIGLHRAVAISALLGAAIGLLLLLTLVATFGGVGATWAVAIAELVVLGYQSIVLARAISTPSSLRNVSNVL